MLPNAARAADQGAFERYGRTLGRQRLEDCGKGTAARRSNTVVSKRTYSEGRPRISR